MLIEIALLSLITILIGSISFSLIYFSVTHRRKIDREHDLNKIRQTENYISILHMEMQKAYNIVYKNRVLAYSMDGYNLDDNEYNAALRDFNNLVLKLLGPSLQNNLIDFFGDYETLVLNMSEYFNDRYENDEIRQSSMGSLMNQDNVE